MLFAIAGRIPTGLHLLAGDELVHVVEALVVAGVDDDGAVVGDVDVGALVLEPAQRGVLDRRRVGIPRVELDDVAEPVDLVGRLGDVEARVEGLPLQLGRLQRDAVAVEPVGVHRVGRRRALGGAEVLVEVLLARKHRAPRGHPAGAVGEGARDGAAGRVGGGLDEVGAGAGTGQRERGVGGDAAVVAAHHRPQSTLGRALDLHDGHAERGDLDVELLAGGCVGVVAGEHELRGDVLVVGHQQEAVRLARRSAAAPAKSLLKPNWPTLGGGGLAW